MYELMMSGSVLGLFLQVVPITCLVGIIYAGCRLIIIRKNHISVAWETETVRWFFICYLTGLFNLILVPNNLWTYIWFYLHNGYSGCELDPLFSGSFNLVPTLIKVLTGEFTMGHWVRTMLSGNFLMFLPFGFFLPFVSRRIRAQTIWKVSIVVPIAVEVIQPIIGRSFDVDDLILNFFGIVAGYFAATGIELLRKKKHT